MAQRGAKNAGWSRATPIVPKENLTRHSAHATERFTPSYEADHCPESMTLLLGWEYARIWLREHNEFLAKRVKADKTKIISNDFTWWLAKRSTNKRFCGLR